MNPYRFYFYLISCNNQNIKDKYVGRTTNFDIRKQSHNRMSKSSNLKLYRKIRECGGWNNWNMKIIYEADCKNNKEASYIEQKYIDMYKCNLNSINACSKVIRGRKTIRFQPLFHHKEDMNIETLNKKVNISASISRYPKCQYCNNEFTNNKILRKHLKLAKYCQKLRVKKTNEFLFGCDYCDECFYEYDALEIHSNNCVKKYQIEIEKLKLEVKQLKEKLNQNNIVYNINNNGNINICDNMTIKVKINNYLSNMKCLDLSDERIENIIKTKLSQEHVINGQKGIAHFVVDNILKDENGNLSYICSDFSRKVFQYKNGREIVKDLSANKLIDKLISNKLCEKIKEIFGDKTIDSKINKKIDEISAMNYSNSIFKKELAIKTTL